MLKSICFKHYFLYPLTCLIFEILVDLFSYQEKENKHYYLYANSDNSNFSYKVIPINCFSENLLLKKNFTPHYILISVKPQLHLISAILIQFLLQIFFLFVNLVIYFFILFQLPPMIIFWNEIFTMSFCYLDHFIYFLLNSKLNRYSYINHQANFFFNLMLKCSFACLNYFKLLNNFFLHQITFINFLSFNIQFFLHNLFYLLIHLNFFSIYFLISNVFGFLFDHSYSPEASISLIN